MKLSQEAQIKGLSQQIAAEMPDAVTQVTAFPSQAVMLDVRCNGRAFVMAYSPNQGFGVDEVPTEDGLDSSYRHEFRDFEPAANRLRELIALDVAKAPPSLNLVVVYSLDMDAARDFYRLLGMSFVSEQHGSGPRHYAATMGDMVFELYPRRDEIGATSLRLGFRVPSVDPLVEQLQGRGIRVVSPPKDSPWGRRAVVEDPDGNRIELAEARATKNPTTTHPA